LLYGFLEAKLNPLLSETVIHFSPESIDKFRAWLISQGRAGRTVEERIRYIRSLISDLGWSIDIYKAIEYMSKLPEHKRDHVRKSLRLYLRFTKRMDLLELLSGGWRHAPREIDVEPSITLEEAKEVIEIAKTISVDYALYLAALLVTGLRPSELRGITWRDQSSVDPKIFRVNHETKTKRSYYAFLTPGLLKLLEDARGSSDKLVRWRRETEYKVLKVVRLKHPGFKPYDLRSLNTYILYLRKVDPLKIKLIHGWIPQQEVMTKYYLIKHLNKNETLLEILSTHNNALADIDEWIRSIFGKQG